MQTIAEDLSQEKYLNAKNKDKRKASTFKRQLQRVEKERLQKKVPSSFKWQQLFLIESQELYEKLHPPEISQAEMGATKLCHTLSVAEQRAYHCFVLFEFIGGSDVFDSC